MNDKTKQYIKELMRPVYDKLVDSVCSVYDAVEKQVPASVPLEQKRKLMETVMENQAKMLEASIKKAVPEDFGQKLKEEWKKNGTKS